jgi:YidC/Oxa1 family membrane protein insertase
MEQARLFLAIVLSFLVFLVWDLFIAEKVPPPEPVKENVQQTEQTPENAPSVENYSPSPLTEDTGTAPLAEPAPRAGDPRIITVKTPFYIAQISEKGAVFKSFTLNDYKQDVEDETSHVEMISRELHTGAVQTEFAGQSLPGLKEAVFSADIEADTLTVGEQPETIIFSWRNSDGIVFEKIFRFSPDTYMMDLSVVVKNGTDRPLQDNLVISLANTVPQEKRVYGFEGPSALINNSLEQVDLDDIEDKNRYDGRLQWLAIETRYFLSGIIPAKPAEATMRLILKDNILVNQYVHPSAVITPGTLQQFDFHLFFGPKSLKILGKLNVELDRAVNFGMFDFIAKPCLWLMNYLHDHLIANYGVAIIILTILIKLLLWPLGNISYKSMNEMKKLQPLMTQIREKYKDDKKMMNQELMALYKTYKVNPMGGCLPMVAQIPVFFALYRMLYEAIELRHAAFIPGWINDLSAPERLFRFDIESIPFMDPPYGIPLLTIIMGGTMLLQQKMSPPPGDPAQAKMMMFMPIVFTVIFVNFSSGLVLYWLVNNILSIAQQHYISKKTS